MTYVSSATRLLEQVELTQLLGSSRVNNERDEITGMLLYKDGNFIQTVEGREDAVDQLQQRLAGDSRHAGMFVLLDGLREERLFDGWTMGFRDLSGDAASDVPGYSEFLTTPFTAEAFGEDPEASQRLLLSFKRNMR
jgi:hypothetical protein